MVVSYNGFAIFLPIYNELAVGDGFLKRSTKLIDH